MGGRIGYVEGHLEGLVGPERGGKGLGRRKGNSNSSLLRLEEPWTGPVEGPLREAQNQEFTKIARKVGPGKRSPKGIILIRLARLPVNPDTGGVRLRNFLRARWKNHWLRNFLQTSTRIFGYKVCLLG